MKRTMLGAGVLLLLSACGTSAGTTVQGTTVPVGQQVQGPAVQPAQPISAPVRVQPVAPAPKEAVTPQPAATRPAANPAPTAQPGSGSGPGEGTGVPQCPMGGNPPLHRLCPQ